MILGLISVFYSPVIIQFYIDLVPQIMWQLLTLSVCPTFFLQWEDRPLFWKSLPIYLHKLSSIEFN
jgi:hypothetical protein